MIRDFSQQLKSIGGLPLVEKDAPVTLRMVAVNALLSPSEDDKHINGEEKYKRFKLADRIHMADSVDVTAEDIALIKRLVGTLYPPVIVGPVYNVLEGET